MSVAAVVPEGPRIPGISAGIVVEKAGLMFLSGHVPITQSGEIVVNDLEAQAHHVFENIQRTLHAGNCGVTDIIRLTLYVRDLKPEHLETIREVRDHYINRDRPPASALIGVASLFHPDILIEIDAIAVTDTNRDEAP